MTEQNNKLQQEIINEQVEKNATLLLESQRVGRTGSYFIDFKTKCWSCTSSLDEILGIDAEYIKTTDSYFDLIHPDDRKMMKNYFQREIIEEKQNFEKEYRIIRKNDGAIRWMYGFGKLDLQESNPYSMYGIVQDITQRKQTEEKLHESEKRYKIITENTLDIVFALDKKGTIVYMNKSVFDILGYENEDVIGTSFTKFVPKKAIPQYFLKLKDVFLQKEIHNFQTQIYSKEGKLMDVEINGKLVTQENELMALGTIRDVTEKKLVEKKLLSNNKELKELNATKDKFFSIIAHDLKNPFNAILGFSQILNEEINDENYLEAKKYSSIIYQSSKRAMDLLKNLFEWSLSHTGKMVFSPEYFELARLIDEVITLLSDVAKQKSIVIKKTTFPISFVYADKNMISTVLRNLISNAIKFTDLNGEIVISIAKQEGEIIISVEDNGIGIAKDRMVKIFQIDKNISTQGTQNELGTGLGLILCKEFVDQHNGRIIVKSKVGKGSKFSFTLPYDSSINEQKYS